MSNISKPVTIVLELTYSFRNPCCSFKQNYNSIVCEYTVSGHVVGVECYKFGS